MASPNPNAEPIDSPLARSTASTTTETKPYVASLQTTDGVTILYSGSRGSKLEPCGCRTLNLGGIDREAAMVHAIRSLTSATLMVDAGGFFREFTDENLRLQGYHLAEALQALGIDAMNVSYWDLRQGFMNLQRLQRDLKLPLISSNIVNKATREPVFDGYKQVTVKTSAGKSVRVAIVGVTAPNYNTAHPTEAVSNATTTALLQPDVVPRTIDRNTVVRRWTIAHTTEPAAPMEELGGAAAPTAGGGNSPALDYAFHPTTATARIVFEVGDEIECLKPLVEKLRPDNDVIVLLSFCGWDRTKKILQSVPGIDLGISGEFLRRYEPEHVGKALLVAPDHDGKYLGQAEVAVNAAGKVAEVKDQLIPILQSIEPEKEYARFVDAYKRESENLPIPETQQIAEKIYAGSTSCRTCHAAEFTQWKTHPHSHAMKTLVDKGMQYNVDCLRCHTVAYKQPGGFTDLRVTPGLSNVQCEVCHGPAQKHVEEKQRLAAAGAIASGADAATSAADPHKGASASALKLRMQWDAKFCMQCHDPANDPLFKFEDDIKRVRHQNPAAPRERPTTVSLNM